MILALDPAAKCGWALGPELSGVWYLAEPDPRPYGKRFHELWLNLANLNDRYCIERIVYEKVVRHRGTIAAHHYGGYKAIIESFAFLQDIPTDQYAVQAIKYFATRDRKASKAQMVEAARKKFDIPIIDDNHADALWIWQQAQERWDTWNEQSAGQ